MRFIITYTLNGRTTYVNGRTRATHTQPACPKASAKTPAQAKTYTAKQAAKYAAELADFVGESRVAIVPAPNSTTHG